MRIERVGTRAVVAPLQRPITTASGTVDRAPLVLIDLHTTDGVVGRSYLFSYHPWALRALDALVTGLGEMIVGEVVAPVRLTEKLRAAVVLLGGRGLVGLAVSGLDMAAWDALAQQAGRPLRVVPRRHPGADPELRQPRVLRPAEAGKQPRRRSRPGSAHSRSDSVSVRSSRTWRPCGPPAQPSPTTSS